MFQTAEVCTARLLAGAPAPRHGQDARATSCGMAILAMSPYGQNPDASGQVARATSCGMAILAMSPHGQDPDASGQVARATSQKYAKQDEVHNLS